jgi:hypothetical protein
VKIVNRCEPVAGAAAGACGGAACLRVASEPFLRGNTFNIWWHLRQGCCN